MDNKLWTTLNFKHIGQILIFFVVVLSLAMLPKFSDAASVAADGDVTDFSFYGDSDVERAVRQIGPKAEARIKPFFNRAGIPYPSERLGLVILKDEMRIEVWAESDSKWRHVRNYKILAASGWQGPKLKRGDRQVPEGIYQIVALNPASRFHLSMKINYPNDYDLERAREEKRSDLGGDIYIHGKNKSTGCLAIGDKSIEELFLLVAKTGPSNVTVIIAPNDMRKYGPEFCMPSEPSWLPDLYQSIWQELTKFRMGKGGA